MSDYQTVTVTKKSRSVVTLEVVEDNNVPALAAILQAGRIRKGAESDAVKLGAMLLLEDKARGGDISPPPDESPMPEQFVSSIGIVSAEEIGKDENGVPLFRATLEIKIKRKADAALFEVGESWGAVAELGGDFDNMFS